ncbi:serine acetyltransferase [Hahella aquimaris]|uniref:serine O-acetyltransferase n=1 Tax=Hahella sp. HNIBRBA332 TaxID=3015983 RepID=UPI00273A9E44|nr:serine acetyltransferase [Hahella sp. HNIBRBA332]WLQ13839.1 serine acetyltransferase [Hahella sp. HNIBRBA332]
MAGLLAADIRRKRSHYVRIDNFVNKYLKITFQLGTLYLCSYRLGHYASRARNPLLKLAAWLLYFPTEFLLGSITGIRIPPQVAIGPGLVIHNFSGVFIDADIVGEDCTVNQCVTVGPDYQRKGRPRLGDNVFIGSGAKILGNITIGDNVVVASNALVIDSVPDNCTVVGAPARVVSRNNTSSYLKFKQPKS